MEKSAVWHVISLSLITRDGRLAVWKRIRERGNWSFEYVEHCIEEGMKEESHSNYGAW